MARQPGLAREMRLGKTESFFYVSVMPPLEANETIDSPAQGVMALREFATPDGSQTLVYARANFGMTAREREPLFRRYAQHVAQRLGRTTLDAELIEMQSGATSLFEAPQAVAA